MVTEPGIDLAVKLAESHDQAEFVGRDLENAGSEPQGDGNQRDDQNPGTAKPAARQHIAQFILSAPQQVFQVGGR
jgi:hypothetical protein